MFCVGQAFPDGWVDLDGDCDDADRSAWRALVRYADGDRDGVGTTPRTILCVGADEPGAGWSRFGCDVDDADPTRQCDEEDDDLILGML